VTGWNAVGEVVAAGESILMFKPCGIVYMPATARTATPATSWKAILT